MNPENIEFDNNKVFDSEMYQYFYDASISEQATIIQCNFILKESGTIRGSRMLDLACGHGRHANKFAEFGIDVTGVDVSQSFISQAKYDADKKNVKVNYLCEDMLNVNFHNQFDIVVCLFSSFGYFNDNDNRRVIKIMSSALSKNGWLCMDIMNRDRLIKILPINSLIERDANFMLDVSSIDIIKNRLKTRRLYFKDGIAKRVSYSVRLYTYIELAYILMEENLIIEKSYGNWNGDPFTIDSPRLILFAKKSSAQYKNNKL